MTFALIPLQLLEEGLGVADGLFVCRIAGRRQGHQGDAGVIIAHAFFGHVDAAVRLHVPKNVVQPAPRDRVVGPVSLILHETLDRQGGDSRMRPIERPPRALDALNG